MSYVLKENYADRSNYGGIRKEKIKYIIVHGTGNDGDTDESNAKYFKRKNLEVSANDFVDDDSITISVPETCVAYAVGGKKYPSYKQTGGAKYYGLCTNSNSFSIEMCDTVKNGVIIASEKTMQNTADRIKLLMIKHNVPIERVLRHFDVTGKPCPSYLIDEKAWMNFKARLVGKDYSPVFNANYYADKYADLKKVFGYDYAKLLDHFLKNGINEHRQACGTFNVDVYKSKNADLQKVFGNNMIEYVNHYINFGRFENRQCV